MTDLTPEQRLRLAELETALTRAQIRAAGVQVSTFEDLARRDEPVNAALKAKADYIRSINPRLQNGPSVRKQSDDRKAQLVTDAVDRARAAVENAECGVDIAADYLAMEKEIPVSLDSIEIANLQAELDEAKERLERANYELDYQTGRRRRLLQSQRGM